MRGPGGRTPPCADLPQTSMPVEDMGGIFTTQEITGGGLHPILDTSKMGCCSTAWEVFFMGWRPQKQKLDFNDLQLK